MRRLLAISVVLACVFSAQAQFYTATITVTNVPAGLPTNIVINGSTRSWTNNINGAPSTSIMATNTMAMSATNLLNHLTRYPLSFFAFLSQDNETNVIVRSSTALTITMSAGWGTVTFVTNTTPLEVTVTMPITRHASTNQTNIATWLAEAAEFSTTSFKMHWPIMAQVAGLTNNNAFTGTNSLRDGGWNRASITNLTTLSGALGRLTNGYSTNLVLDSPTMTNAVVYGGFSSFGSGSASLQLGSTADSAGLESMAFGNLSAANGNYDIAIGNASTADGGASLSIGYGATTAYTNDVAVGAFATVAAPGGGAFGSYVDVGLGHTNSYGIGADTTETNQIMIGASTHKVRIPGQLQVTGSMTNNFLTGSNRIGGAIGFTRRTDASQPTGHNIVTNSASDSVVWFTAPAGACTNVGFTDGWDGRVIRYVKYNGGYFMGIANESGLASAERRVLTGTGADVTITNSPGWFDLMYDATLSRWILLGYSR